MKVIASLLVCIILTPAMIQALTLADITHNSSEILYANPAAGEIRVKIKKGAATVSAAGYVNELFHKHFLLC